MKTKIHSIPETMDTYWVSDVNAVLDVWKTNTITQKDLDEALLIDGINQLKTNHGNAFILDSSETTNPLTTEMQTHLGKDVFPSLANNGVKYFITVPPKQKNQTRTPIKNLTTNPGPNGIQLLEVNNQEDAIEWLKLHR